MKLKKFYYKKIKSTNDIALKYLKKGIEKGAILADFQTKGKGQRGKKWISFKGNLFMSVFFEVKNKISLEKITKLNCYIVRDCLQKFTSFKIVIKKPNDIYINRQKICGILQEIIKYNNKYFIIVGIGINIVESPRINKYQTTYLNKHLNRDVSKYKIFFKIKKIFENNIINLQQCS